MATAARTLSEFLQRPSAIMPDLARGPVVLHRRDAEDLVVMKRDHNDALETALRLLAAVTAGGTAAAEATVPWLTYLGRSDRETCVRELATAAATAASTGRLDLLRDTLYAWESTALAAWDLSNRGSNPAYAADEPVSVPRPAE